MSFDEVASILVSQRADIFLHSIRFEEGNSWAYYLLLHFWLMLGSGEFMVRSLSVVFAVATIPVFYLVAKKLFSEKVARIAIILLPLHILFIYSAQAARGYSLELFLSILGVYFFLKAREEKKFLIPYVISVSLSIYAHLFSGFVFLAETVFLRKFLPFLAVGILCLPLLLMPSFHSGQVDWIPHPSLLNIAATVVLLTGDFLPLLIINSFLFVYSFFQRKKSTDAYGFTCAWLLVPIFLAYVISFVKPIYVSGYLKICLPAVVLLIASGIEKMEKRFGYVMLACLVVLSCVRLYGWYGENSLGWRIGNTNEQWREAALYVSQNSQASDGIIFYAYFTQEPFFYYFKKPLHFIELSSRPYPIGGGKALDAPKSISFTEPRIWLIESFVKDQPNLETIHHELSQYSLIRDQKFEQIDVQLYAKLPEH